MNPKSESTTSTPTTASQYSRLSPTDLMFLRLESDEWPCHFGGLAIVDADHVLHQPDDVVLGQRAMLLGYQSFQVQVLVQFVAADSSQIITALVIQLFHQVLAGVVQCRRIARSHALVELDQRLLGDRPVIFPLRLLIDAALNVDVFRVRIQILKQGQDFSFLPGLVSLHNRQVMKWQFVPFHQ